MHELLNHVPGGIRAVLKLIGVAEEALEAAGQPNGVRLSDLVAPRAMVHLHVAVYRSHARELVARAGTTTPLSVPTLAELLVAMHAVTLKAPLTRPAAVLYHHLFREVFGPEVYERLVPPEDQPKPEWPEQLQEELAAARRSIRVQRGPA